MADKEQRKRNIQGSLAAAEEVQDIDTTGMPVRCIGHDSGFYYFISPVGQQRAYKFNEFSFNGILSLFEGDVTWLEDNFPRMSGRGRRIVRDGFELDEITAFLMRECKKAGLYSSEMSVRRCGVWAESAIEESGMPTLVVHSGDTLLINGEECPSGDRIGDSFYEAAPKIAKPADKPATVEQTGYLQETLAMWNFSRGSLDVKLMTGFIAQALLGAGPKWRVHCMVTAPSGSGKSFLTETIANIMGAGAHEANNNFTEAYLRQSMTNEARCMILDEAEHEEGGGRVKHVIELLRHMSGGKGSSGGRGGAGGKSQSFKITGCAYMASILHVPLKPQDKNRILHLMLEPFPDNTPPDQVRDLEKRMTRLKKLSPAFRRRMIDGWHRYLANFEMYHPAFMQAGLNSRSADHLATLYAAADVFLYDEVARSETIVADVRNAAYMIEYLREQASDNEGVRCLHHLYSSVVDAWKGGDKQTIGQLIAQAVSDNDKACNKKLGPYGIRYEVPDYVNNLPGRLIIANTGQGLERVFEGTHWSGGVWSQALGYLGGGYSGACRFAGVNTRGMIIPKDHWPTKEDD
jgi:hypothetical protein